MSSPMLVIMGGLRIGAGGFMQEISLSDTTLRLNTFGS